MCAVQVYKLAVTNGEHPSSVEVEQQLAIEACVLLGIYHP
jgi:hypothetical protein